MTDLRWREEPAHQLTARELHDVLALRSDVFIVEQACAYHDIDGQDLLDGTRHLWAEDSQGIVAYARLLAPEDGRARIGRVVTAAQVRGTGLGHILVDRALESCARTWPDADVKLAAQAHLQDFYGSHGFVPVSEAAPYVEDGILHLDMVWAPAPNHRSGR